MIRRIAASTIAVFFASTLALGAVTPQGSEIARAQRESAPQMPSRTLSAPPRGPEAFRAAQMRPVDVAALSAPQKSAGAAGPTLDEHGRLRIGTVRSLAKATAIPDWASIPDGFVSTMRASSDGARGLRVQLDVGRRAAPLEVRAQGTDGRIESMTVYPDGGSQVWTPWTEGAAQVIELYSPSGAPLPSASVVSVVHFDLSPTEKASASACTVSAMCSTGDATLDSAIAERVNSSVRIVFQDGGSSFLCSATLVNTDRFPAGFLLTANHCVSTPASAGSVTTFWFYEPVSCGDVSLRPGSVQLSGGTTLTFSNYNNDMTLLLMQETPPNGAAYAGWNAALMSSGDAIVSLSHPHGDTTRLARGAITREYRIDDRAQDEYGVSFSSGIIEGGSSGSGLFTLSGGSLQLRGTLTGTTIRNSPNGMSCTDLTEEALYGRFEVFYPQIYPYVTGSGSPIADDAPNRPIDYNGVPLDTALNGRTVTLSRSIEHPGDVDVFRFSLSAQASVTVGTQGSLDTVGTLMDANGKPIAGNDDVGPNNVNFGITKTLEAGTYFVMVAPWDANGAGAYTFQMTAAAPVVTGTNYTDLWWSQESGWGINLAHQGDIIFALLYTYDVNGAPLWLFMSNGNKQLDGTYSGTLYRASGQWYAAPGWGQISTVPMGTMTINFTSANSAQLTYTVAGTIVQKTIQRFQFATPGTTCVFTSGDRTASTNYQDLWWNAAESGWGISIAHEANTMFALMYVYDANGQSLWFSMSNGVLTGTRTYSGTLYRSTGPVFNASPWTNATVSPVGNMTISFADGEHGTLTYTADGIQVVKQITRTVYSNPKPLCSPAT